MQDLKLPRRFTLLNGILITLKSIDCRVLRNDPDLHKFEVAQLGSLCPEEAEEAKTLIPRYELPPKSIRLTGEV